MSSAIAIEAGVVPRADADDVVEVAVLLPVPGTYHYGVPPALRARARVGARVLVEFGKRKVSGVIVRGTAEAGRPGQESGPSGHAYGRSGSAVAGTAPGAVVKPIAELLDDEEPALGVELVALCAWIADYYEAPLGEVLRAALPAGTNVAAAAMVQATAAGRTALAGDGAVLPPRRRDALDAIARAGRLAPRALTARQRTELPALIAAGLVAPVEARTDARVKVAVRRIARLADGVAAAAAAAATARAPKRRAIVDAL